MEDRALSITVGIPTFNRANFLARAVSSCISQEVSDLRIVISDNSSTDETPSFLESIDDPRVVIVQQDEQLPAWRNWNECWRRADSDLFMFLSDDDYLDENFLSELLSLARRYPEAVLWRTTIRAVNDKGDVIWRATYPQIEPATKFIEERVVHGRRQFLPGIACRTEDLNKLGGVIPSGFERGLYDDDLLWFRLVSSRPTHIASTDETSWNYQIHVGQLSQGTDLSRFMASTKGYVAKVHAVLMSAPTREVDWSALLQHYEHQLRLTRIRLEVGRHRNSSMVKMLSVAFSAIFQSVRYGFFRGVTTTIVVAAAILKERLRDTAVRYRRSKKDPES